MTVEEIIAEYERNRIRANKAATENERLGEALRSRLLGVAQRQPPLATITKQTLKRRQIDRCRDHEDVADPGQHQSRQWVIHHRLVVDRQQLLAHRVSDR